MVRPTGQDPGFTRSANPLLTGRRNLDAGVTERGQHGLTGANLNSLIGPSQTNGESASHGRRNVGTEALDMVILAVAWRGRSLERVQHRRRTATVQMGIRSGGADDPVHIQRATIVFFVDMCDDALAKFTARQ